MRFGIGDKVLVKPSLAPGGEIVVKDKDLNFALGNAVKYIVRAGHKAEQGMSDDEKAIQDLEKARQYIDFEIKHRKEARDRGSK